MRIWNALVVAAVLTVLAPMVTKSCADELGDPTPRSPSQQPGSQLPLSPQLDVPEELLPNRIPLTAAAFRLAFEEAQSSIQSIHLRYRSWPADKPQDAASAPVWDWALQGHQYLHKCDTPTERGKGKVCYWVSYDGQDGYVLKFFDDLPTRADQAHKTRQVPDLARKDFFISFMLMKRAGYGAPSPIELVRSAQNPPTGLASSSDSSKAHLVTFLEIPRTKDGTATTLLMKFRLDHEGWPFSATIQPTALPSEEEKKQSTGSNPYRSFEIEEFQFVTDPLLERPRKFPKRLQWRSPGSNLTVSFDEVRINANLPAAMFRPNLPVGAEVTEDPGGPKQKRTVVGGKAGEQFRLARLNAKRASQAHEALSNQQVSPAVALPAKSRIQTYFLAVPILLLVAVSLLWAKRSFFS